MNDPHKCAQCAKAVANGFRSRCVLIEEDHQKYFKANVKLERENMELNANIRKVIQNRDELAAKVAELRELAKDLQRQKVALRDRYEFVDNAEIARQRKERAKVKRLVEAVRKWRSHSTTLADRVKESSNAVMDTVRFGGEVIFTNPTENITVHMVVSKVEVNTD